MKLILKEEQINNLIKILNEEGSIETPNLSNLIKKLSSTGNVSSVGFTPTPSTNDNLKVDDDNTPIHPLGGKGEITSGFGLRNSKIGSKNHKGVDISTPSGSPVYSPLNGVVMVSKDTTPNPCGGFIKIKHQDVQTKFCHLREMLVKEGDQVKKGQIIGHSGGGKDDPYRGRSTGPHLHYEVLNDGGIAMNPVDFQSNLA